MNVYEFRYDYLTEFCDAEIVEQKVRFIEANTMMEAETTLQSTLELEEVELVDIISCKQVAKDVIHKSQHSSTGELNGKS